MESISLLTFPDEFLETLMLVLIELSEAEITASVLR